MEGWGLGENGHVHSGEKYLTLNVYLKKESGLGIFSKKDLHLKIGKNHDFWYKKCTCSSPPQKISKAFSSSWVHILKKMRGLEYFAKMNIK